MFDGTVAGGMVGVDDKSKWKLYKRGCTCCIWVLNNEIGLEEHIEVIEHRFELNKK